MKMKRGRRALKAARVGARGGTRRARAEIETGNERELTAIVSQESTLALLKAAASLDEREGRERRGTLIHSSRGTRGKS